MRHNSCSPLMVPSLLVLAVTVTACRPTAPEAEPDPSLNMVAPGRLVVQGQDDNIYLLEQGHEIEALTSDAHLSTSEEASVVRYSDPTWSTSGWLSYVRTTEDQGNIGPCEGSY